MRKGIDIKARTITLEDGSTRVVKDIPLEELRAIAKAIELAFTNPLPTCYFPIIHEIYQRTGGHAPGPRSKTASYGNSKKPRSTWQRYLGKRK